MLLKNAVYFSYVGFAPPFGTYQRHLFQQHSCLRLSLLERGTSSQQSALWVEMCATACSDSEKSAGSSGTGRENTVVTAPCRAAQAGSRLDCSAHPLAGLAHSPEQGDCGNGENRETQHGDCEGRGRRDGGNKTHLGKMHAAVAEERRFGWVAFHVRNNS